MAKSTHVHLHMPLCSFTEFYLYILYIMCSFGTKVKVLVLCLMCSFVTNGKVLVGVSPHTCARSRFNTHAHAHASTHMRTLTLQHACVGCSWVRGPWQTFPMYICIISSSVLKDLVNTHNCAGRLWVEKDSAHFTHLPCALLAHAFALPKFLERSPHTSTCTRFIMRTCRPLMGRKGRGRSPPCLSPCPRSLRNGSNGWGLRCMSSRA